jgi:SAM-dependent methyltransferase
MHAGIRCEDVQDLSYADESFDLVTHTEVLEHVPDDARAFAELHRVLRPGGTLLFTVPLYGGYPTIERARLREGEVEHLMEPAYHIDPLRGAGILAFRDYGLDIVERLRAAGFIEASIVAPRRAIPWLGEFPVILAKKRGPAS